MEYVSKRGPVKPTKKQLQEEEKQEMKDYLLSLFPKVSTDHKGFPNVYCVTTQAKVSRSGNVNRYLKFYVCLNNEIVPITSSIAKVTGDKMKDGEIVTTSDYSEMVVYLSYALFDNGYMLRATSI